MDGIDTIMIWMGQLLSEMELEASKHVYRLREQTREKLNTICSAFNVQTKDTKITFNPVANTACVEVRDYVFDSYVNNMKTAFSLADIIVIDSLKNGLVCISIVVQNAADMLA